MRNHLERVYEYSSSTWRQLISGNEEWVSLFQLLVEAGCAGQLMFIAVRSKVGHLASRFVVRWQLLWYGIVGSTYNVHNVYSEYGEQYSI